MTAVSPAPPILPPARGARESFLRLIAVLGLVVIGAAVLHGLYVLLVVAAIVLMIMVHELGHFVTAKLSGMKVTEYFLGFGPRLWSVRRGETEYGVKAIPAGGYVRIVGMTTAEELNPEDEPRSYREQSFPRRVLVASAGSAMHVVMALVLLFVMFTLSGYPTTAAVNEVSGLSTILGQVSPAEHAGIKPGDELIGVGTHRESINAIISTIEAHPGTTISLLVRRDGHDRSIEVRPLDGRAVKLQQSGSTTVAKKGTRPVGFIGVGLGGVLEQTVGPLDAVPRTFAAFGTVVRQTGAGIATVFSVHGLRSFAHAVATSGRPASTGSGVSGNSGELVSILGAVQIGAQAAQQNLSELLYLLVAINVFVGIANLFPMLPLDGGHVAIAIYERVRTRRGRAYHADVRKLMPVAYVFLAFMLVLGLSALYLNAVHPLSLPNG